MNFKDKSYFYSKFITLKRSGRKSAAQTVAPKKDRIKGSTKNPVGSAASKTAASNIQLNEGALKVLKEKRDKFNEKNKSKSVGLPALKAVMRRGMGAYSTSYRPTITGGKPNSRQAWGYARVNKFLEKKAGKPVKKAYVQDDDLMAKGGQTGQAITCVNCGWHWNTADSDEFDKYICHKCGFDNRTFYDPEPIGFMADGGVLGVPSTEKLIDLVRKDRENKIKESYKLGYKVVVARNDGYYYKKESERDAEFIDAKNPSERKVADIIKNNPDISEIGFNGTIKVGNRVGEELEIADDFSVVLWKKDDSFFKEGLKFEFIQDGGKYINTIVNKNDTITYKDRQEDGKYVYFKQLDVKYNTESESRSKKDILKEEFDNNQAMFIKDKMADGGEMSNQIALPDTYASYESLKPILKNQGYELNKINMDIPVGKLAKGMSLSEVAAIHNLTADDLKSELLIGIETEMEHTDTPEYARAIALDHLFENPNYYTKLKQMEGIDAHYISITKKFAEGGTIDPVFSFKTPTGEPSRLNYLQQVLVRTQGFKNFFGDWESAANNFLKDDKNNYEKHYQNVSKVIEYSTLEPRVVFHGTKTEDEFFRFDVTKEKGVGRPYGYFAHNKEYSENFTKGSQRGASNSQPFIYQCFVNVRNPFIATTREYWQKNKDEDGWQNAITGTLVWDKYKSIEKNEQSKEIEESVNSQIGSYIKSIFSGDKKPFWRLMAGDIEKDFKYFLMAYGYDGVYYGEEFSSIFDPENPSEYTQAVTIFDSKQVKLADGRNLNFNPMLDDIRYEDGGMTDDNQTEIVMNKKDKLGNLITGNQYKVGGTVITEHGKTNDAKKGGYFHGQSHDEGGIKAINVDTGQMIEVEGEEVIITKNAVNDEEKREFEGEMLTNRQILSKINQSGGGVAFEDGGEIKAHTCGCSGKKFKFGGEMYEDFQIIRFLNDPQKISTYKIKSAKQYVDTLLEKMK